MLDFRLETFLILCREKSYTKTAAILHITQPAVTQHIKYLEKSVGGKLFIYADRRLSLTPKGVLLKEYAMAMQASTRRLRLLLETEEQKDAPIRFGATLTIGEYTMPPILTKLLQERPHLDITMEVDNTKRLLSRLQDGAIDFALVEGRFDKSKYQWHTLKNEPFIGICGNQSPFKNQTIPFSDLLNSRIILREEGSGSRDIFEQMLHEYNYSIDSFWEYNEIGNISAIKQMVKNDLGISFLYQTAVEAELSSGTLHKLQIDGVSPYREFNFVYLQNSPHAEEYIKWFHVFQQKMETHDPSAK